jgi:hypothetical protein
MDEGSEDEGSESNEECEEETCNHDHSVMNELVQLDTLSGDVSLDKLRAIIKKNGVDEIFLPLDGTALYSIFCKINHSCNPNVMVKYVFTLEYGLVAQMVALREIKAGEELLQSYIDQKMGKPFSFYCII